MEELTVLPRDPSWFWGEWEDRNGKGREKEVGAEGRAGEWKGPWDCVFPVAFFLPKSATAYNSELILETSILSIIFIWTCRALPRLRYDRPTLIINLWKNIAIKLNIPGRRQLSWHADSGQLHFAIDQTGRRAPLWSCVRPCDVAFLLRNTVCAAGLRFRPGRAAFKANGPGRAGF